MSSTLPMTGRRLRGARGDLPGTTPSAADLPPALPVTPSSVSAQQLRLTAAGPGDHPLIQRLLSLSGHAPAADEFHLQLDEPEYDAHQRLVVRLDGDLVGHVRISRRQQHFGKLTLSVAVIRDLAVLPDYRRLALAPALLQAAVNKAHSLHVQAVLWPAPANKLATAQGFVSLPTATLSSARPRDVLASLTAAGYIQHDPHEADVPLWPLNQAAQPLTIRWWRHYELEGLRRLYAQQTASENGAFARTPERWQWLISRQGYDRIYVAIDGPDSWALEDTHPRMLGYAVVRESRIVELVTAPQRPAVAAQLLARVCGDAVEQDYYHVHLDAPPHHPLHQIFATAAHGARAASPASHAWQMKVFALLRLLEQLGGVLAQRLRDSQQACPHGLGLLVDEQKYLLNFGPRSLKLVAGKVGRSYLSLDAVTLAKLLLGVTSVHSELAAGALTTSCPLALSTAECLFPKQDWWLPPWEELPARG